MIDAELDKLIEEIGFTTTDFFIGDVGLTGTHDWIASQANTKLRTLLRDARVVKGYENSNVWLSYEDGSVKTPEGNHTAILFNIKPIKKKCERHEPLEWTNENHTVPYKSGYVDRFKAITYEPKCKHCSVPLRAEWRAVEEGE